MLVSVLMSPSFPRKQDQRGRGTGPRSHRSLDRSCGRPPTHPAWPGRGAPASLGRAAPAPTWPKAQAGIRPLPLPPITQSEGGAVRTQGSAPLRQCPARPQSLALRHPPQEFNPVTAEGRARDPHSRPAGIEDKEVGETRRGGRALQPLHPEPAGRALGRAERAGGRISGGTGRALRTMVPWRWGLTGPRGIALPPAAGPGPLHEAPRWGPPPRRAPRPWPPGARPGWRRRWAAASPAAEQLRPRSLGRGGRGARGADWSPRVSWGRRLDA